MCQKYDYGDLSCRTNQNYVQSDCFCKLLIIFAIFLASDIGLTFLFTIARRTYHLKGKKAS